jgi:hypothetical protein
MIESLSFGKGTDRNVLLKEPDGRSMAEVDEAGGKQDQLVRGICLEAYFEFGCAG